GNKVKDECIIAFKVYDFCRMQECLTAENFGPARAAADSTYCDRTVSEGDVIVPPSAASSVTVENLTVQRVVIVNKIPNPFKPGYWDIDLKYVFGYRLVFHDVNGNEICNVNAQNSYNSRMTLFGSIATQTLISSDILGGSGESANLPADPFVIVESKAVALSAEIHYNRCCCDTEESLMDNADIHVTIGLFAIVKLFRLVNLVVESKGFCIPKECEDISSVDACEFFNSLDFPMDIFAPPQRAEFVAGVSANIPASTGGTQSQGGGCCGGCGCTKCGSCTGR
ncbi:MAG: hypothetical protein IJR59_02370, partial [Firmicutes bacterium]|nr:hypothetical protein [Bacillota bacterium]